MRELKGTEKKLIDQGFEFDDLTNYPDGLFSHTKGIEVFGDNKDIPVNVTNGGIEIPVTEIDRNPKGIEVKVNRNLSGNGVEVFSKTGRKDDNAWMRK
jgi:hypothetical protein